MGLVEGSVQPDEDLRCDRTEGPMHTKRQKTRNCDERQFRVVAIPHNYAIVVLLFDKDKRYEMEMSWRHKLSPVGVRHQAVLASRLSRYGQSGSR